MRFFKEFIQGLHILEKYETKGTDLGASHDNIHIWDVDIKNIPAEDIRQLASLGFYPGSDDENREDILLDNGYEGDLTYFDTEKITEEQWNILKEHISNDFYYYT